MSRRTLALGIALLVLPVVVLAQGTSPLKVTGISISPANVTAGSNVAITVSIQNTATRTYGCTGAYFNIAVYVFKDAPNLTANQVFTTTQPVTPFAPGETRSVPITTHWTVPTGDAASYHVVAWSPLCAPEEFGQQGTLTLRKSCSYSAIQVMVPITKVPRRLP